MSDIIFCACGCNRKLSRLDKYNRPRQYITGHNTPRKYKDPTQFKREWNHRNKRARYNAKKDRWRMLKIQLLLIFGSACEECGIEYTGMNAAIFHFHHVNKNKKFAIGNQLVNKSWDAIIKEAIKCRLLCANCHELCHSGKF